MEEPKEPKEPKAKVTVIPVDRLELENATLRMLLAQQKAATVMLQMQIATKEQNDALIVLNEAKENIEKAYGIDLEQHTIGPDGNVVDRETTKLDVTKLLEKIRTQ